MNIGCFLHFTCKNECNRAMFIRLLQTYIIDYKQSQRQQKSTVKQKFNLILFIYKIIGRSKKSVDEVETAPPTRKTRSTNAAKKSVSTESTNSGDSGINSPKVAQNRNSKRSKKEDRNDSAISKVSQKSKASISKPKEKTKAVSVFLCNFFFLIIKNRQTNLKSNYFRKNQKNSHGFTPSRI